MRKNKKLFWLFGILLCARCILVPFFDTQLIPYNIYISPKNNIVQVDGIEFGKFPLSNGDLSALNDLPLVFPGFTENRGQIPDPTLYYYFMQEMYIIGFYDSKLQIFARLSPNDPWENITLTFPGASVCIP